MNVTSNELRAARLALGMTQAELAAALRMGKHGGRTVGKHGGRTVRRWELGEIEVPGPVAVAIEMLVEKAEAMRRLA